MSETLAADQQEFTEGRYGILIPKIDTKELEPHEFLQFFRDTLHKNIGADDNLLDYGVLNKDVSFVIPQSEQKPLVLLNYKNSTGGIVEPSESYSVLTPPEKPGKFESFLEIYQPVISMSSIMITPKDEETFIFNRTRNEYGWSGPWIRTGKEITTEDLRQLGSIASDFIELVS